MRSVPACFRITVSWLAIGCSALLGQGLTGQLSGFIYDRYTLEKNLREVLHLILSTPEYQVS